MWVKHPAYDSWSHMIQRCTNPKSQDWPNYGGRGITICDRWFVFSNFAADMGERPYGTTLDRKDNEKGYSPDNCKWSTRVEQERNKRSNRRLIVEGVSRTVAEWAELLGIRANTITLRLRRGWPVERALKQ
jgi:hypothetical protein